MNLATILSNAKVASEQEALKQALNKARHDAHIFIGRRRLELDELPNHTIVKVAKEYDEVTFITAEGEYFHITIFDEYNTLSTHENLEILDAHRLGVLPQTYLDAINKAQEACDESTKEETKRWLLIEAVTAAGVTATKELLSEMEAHNAAD